MKWSVIDFTANTISIKHKVLQNGSKVKGYDVMKTKSSCRTLPLIPSIVEELRREKERHNEMQRLMGRSYNHQYDEYICVDAIGELIRPNYVTQHFPVVLKQLILILLIPVDKVYWNLVAVGGVEDCIRRQSAKPIVAREAGAPLNSNFYWGLGE